MLLQSLLKSALVEAVALAFPEGIGDTDIRLEAPPNPQFGDFSSPVCLGLARILRTSPLVLAERLASTLRERGVPYTQEITVTPPGYVNLRLDYGALAAGVVEEVAQSGQAYGKMSQSQGQKVVIEHTNINPNKAAHIGHVRNACLGDALARMLIAAGYEVEVQNYIDDTGTAVADLVVGFDTLGWQEDERPFDYFCWDLYTAINDAYERTPELKQKQADVLHAIEHGDNDTALRAKNIATRIVGYHLKTMARLGIHYDILTWESDILKLGFWKHAFETLQGNGALHLETEGPNQGCWVVKLSDREEFAGLENPDKILVRSNGVATYVAKDIAYQLWKFGVLGKDFNYGSYAMQDNGVMLWSSKTEDGEPGNYGRAERVINVIDVRQKYLQDVLRLSLDQLGYHQQAENSVHFAYEVVTLSAEAARELGVEIELDDERETVAMAGRKGIGVIADDLINRVVEKAIAEVTERHDDYTPEQCTVLGKQIAQAAIRYYMQRYNMSSQIKFDFSEALNMRGNSGPYLQYAHARANNIIDRAAKAGVYPTANLSVSWELSECEQALVRRIAEFPETLLKAADSLSPSMLADYAYQLASTFMTFYELVPVMNAAPEVAVFRLSLVAAYKQTLANTLDVMGIAAPNRM